MNRIPYYFLRSPYSTCRAGALRRSLHRSRWPLHDIDITNIICCMAKQGGSVEGRILRNGRAIALQQGRLCRWGGGSKRMIDSYNKALK